MLAWRSIGLLWPLSAAEWRHHRGRHLATVLAVALGVALACAVQIINRSALSEFSQAVRASEGTPDLALRPDPAVSDALPEAEAGTRALQDGVQAVSPVIELDTLARRDVTTPPVTLRLLGADVLALAQVQPGLLPRPLTDDPSGARSEGPSDASSDAPTNDRRDAGGGLTRLLAGDAVSLNAAARARLGLGTNDRQLQLRTPEGWRTVRLVGTLATGGAPLALADIAAVQDAHGAAGRLSRLDLKLQPGVDAQAWRAAHPPAAGQRWVEAEESAQRTDRLSRAYRVNLSVLALVALLVGGFLVYAVVALSVAQRLPQLALLGVLGMDAATRRRWLLAEQALLGTVGSVGGLAVGAALAWAALRLLGGDLGGGYFSGGSPPLVWPVAELAGCVGAGIAAAVAGAWWPAQRAARIAPALVLKGLGTLDGAAPGWRTPLLALLLAAALAACPPIDGIAWAAYASVAVLLAAGVRAVPALVQTLTRPWPHPGGVLPLLALRRAVHARQTSSAAMGGLVASLALSVALTVMVGSFRQAVDDWLTRLLPADVYLRAAGGSTTAAQTPWSDTLLTRIAAVPGIDRLQSGRSLMLNLRPDLPPVQLLARRLGPDPGASLPLLDETVRTGPATMAGTSGHARSSASSESLSPPASPGSPAPSRPSSAASSSSALSAAASGSSGAAAPLPPIWISEAMAALYGWQPGQTVHLPPVTGLAGATRWQVAGLWRDYARQHGAVVVDLDAWQRTSGDRGLNEIALWLRPGTAGDSPALAEALRAAAGAQHPLELASTGALRRQSLALFDRSFAVTRWLQAVAVGVGLVGVAASLSAQVLARRKEFGLLRHLGFTRRQVLALVTLETGCWLLAGALVGLGLGAAMAWVLVAVVNPQSFHWTMPLHWPAPTLAALVAAVLAAGLAASAWAARRALAGDLVRSVKEDW
ncbi:MAG: hypothetical protein RLY78_332 [Pseudomonadota bacterium]